MSCQDEIKDSWMDDIDWVKVKQNSKEEAEEKAASSSSDSEPEDVDQLSIRKGKSLDMTLE